MREARVPLLSHPEGCDLRELYQCVFKMCKIRHPDKQQEGTIDTVIGSVGPRRACREVKGGA